MFTLENKLLQEIYKKAISGDLAFMTVYLYLRNKFLKQQSDGKTN